MKNNNKMPKKYIKALSNIFLWTRHTDLWYNMLETLERRRKYVAVILSIETHYYNFRYLTNMSKIRSRGFDRAQYCNVNQI